MDGPDFTLSIAALPAGKYTITIGETETVATAAGQRIVSVLSGDSALAQDYDIFKAAGGARQVTTITGTVEHKDDAARSGPL